VYALKRTRQQPAQILQLAQIINDLHGSGFPNVMTLRATKSGQPYARILNETYLLSPWIEGESPDFTSQRHLQMAAKLYGHFHRISQTISLPGKTDISPPEPVRAIQNEFLEKRAFLITISDSLQGKENSNRIDRHLLKWSGHFIRQAGFCIEQLSTLKPDEWCRKNMGQGFCHNDPAPGNIIIRNRELYLIDFELAAPGLLIKDAAKLLVRSLQANRWPPGLIPLIIEAYTAERELSKEEMLLLPYLCAFPQSFWRLCSQRFQEQLPWTETRFRKKLWEITGAEPARLSCLRSMIPELPEFTEFPEPTARMRAISIPSRRKL
jgi:CotS family spore coat protein